MGVFREARGLVAQLAERFLGMKEVTGSSPVVASRFRWGEWNAHLCALDADCCYFMGPVWRLYIGSPIVHVSIALRDQDRFVGRWGKGLHWVNVKWIWQSWAIERAAMWRETRGSSSARRSRGVRARASSSATARSSAPLPSSPGPSAGTPQPSPAGSGDGAV